ncbi:MAG: hypothetical protein IKW77_01135 [Salinivirgaceae bacterium]|nr:hypothetical protein [Salinivirgaceae bacterium]
MRKVLIVGMTMFSAELCEILRREGVKVIGYSVDNAYRSSDSFYGLPIFSFEEIEKDLDMTSVEVALTLGYSQMNDNRELKYRQCKEKGVKLLTYVSKQSQVYTEKIGEGSLILPGTYVGPYSEIGLGTIIRPGTVLAHHDKIGNYNWIADGCTLGGGVIMGSHCFLGLGTTIRNEVSIADYTFIGAHSYVAKDTELSKAYIGIPAKKVCEKDAYKMVCKV